MTNKQQEVVTQLARHFKVKRDIVRAVVEEILKAKGGASPILEIDLREITEHTVATLSVATTAHTSKASQMLFYKSFARTELFSEAFNYLKNDGVDVVVFSSGSAVMCIRLAASYDGIGGIFVKERTDAREGYCIEPFINYLAEEYPIHLDL